MCSLFKFGNASNHGSRAHLAIGAAEVDADKHALADEQGHQPGAVVCEGHAIINDGVVVSTGIALSAEAEHTEHDDACNDAAALEALKFRSHPDEWSNEGTNEIPNIDHQQTEPHPSAILEGVAPLGVNVSLVDG